MASAGSTRTHEADEANDERRMQPRIATASAAAAHSATAAAAAASTSSPASMLYSHALESIFAFCSLKELAALMSVSRSWQWSVLRMRPIEGRFSVASGSAVEQIARRDSIVP